MGINNLDIMYIVQKNLLISFDIIIQHISHIRRKNIQ